MDADNFAERLALLEKDIAEKTKRLVVVEKEFKKKHENDNLEMAKNLITVCFVSWLCFGLTGKRRSLLNINLKA